MKRAEVIDEAKQLVLAHGPSNVQEFGMEMAEQSGLAYRLGEDAAAEVVAEARKQADRVYRFLGYSSPWAP